MGDIVETAKFLCLFFADDSSSGYSFPFFVKYSGYNYPDFRSETGYRFTVSAVPAILLSDKEHQYNPENLNSH